MGDAAREMAVTRILDAIAREVRALAVEADQLQSLVGELLNQGVADDGQLERAQRLDHITQHASELVRVIEALADAASDSWRVSMHETLGGLSLAALAARLANAHAVPAATDVAGDFEFL